MEETSNTSSPKKEEISISIEEKQIDPPELSSSSSSQPNETGRIPDQEEWSSNVFGEESLDKFQNVFRLQKEKEHAPIIENLELLPPVQENPPLTCKLPEEGATSPDTAQLSVGVISDITYDVPDDQEQSERFKSCEHPLVHTNRICPVQRNVRMECTEEISSNNTLDRNVFNESFPEVTENKRNETSELETSNQMQTSEIEITSDPTCHEEYIDLDSQPEICFAEEQEHKNDYSLAYIAEGKGTKIIESSSGSLVDRPRSLQGCGQISAQIPFDKGLDALKKLALLPMDGVLEESAQPGGERQKSTASPDTEEVSRMELLSGELSSTKAEVRTQMPPDTYFGKAAIYSRSSELKSNIESVANGCTLRSPVEIHSQTFTGENNVAGETAFLDSLNQLRQADLTKVIASHERISPPGNNYKDAGYKAGEPEILSNEDETKGNMEGEILENQEQLDIHTESCSMTVNENSLSSSSGSFIQTKNQADKPLTSNNFDHDLVDLDADFKTCMDISKPERAEPTLKEVEVPDTTKQTLKTQEMAAKCEEILDLFDPDLDDYKYCTEKLQSPLNWASTTVEVDPTDNISSQEVFPLQFSKLVASKNEEHLEDNMRVSTREEHDISLTSPLIKTTDDADLHFTKRTENGSSTSHKQVTHVITALEYSTDIGESPDNNISDFTIEKALQTVVPEHGAKAVSFATPIAEVTHAQQTQSWEFNLCECLPQQTSVQSSCDDAYLANSDYAKVLYRIPEEYCTQRQVNCANGPLVLTWPVEKETMSASSPVPETILPANILQSVPCLVKSQISTRRHVIRTEETEKQEDLLVARGIPATSPPVTECNTSDLESPLLEGVTPEMELMIETDGDPSQLNCPFVQEFEDELYDSNSLNICGQIPCPSSYENAACLMITDVPGRSAGDMQRAEKGVTCFFAAATSTEAPWEAMIEEENTSPYLSQDCNLLQVTLASNVPKELHVLPLASDSMHLAFEPQTLESVHAEESEMPDVSVVPTQFSVCEHIYSSEVTEKDIYNDAQNSRSSTSSEFHSITEPEYLDYSVEEAINNFPSEKPMQQHLLECEENLQRHGEVLPREMVLAEAQEVHEEDQKEADVSSSVQAPKPCTEMPEFLSKYVENRQCDFTKRKNSVQNAEQDETGVNGNVVEDFDTKYAEFVGRVLPGFEVFYSRGPNQVLHKVESRAGVFTEKQNRELVTVPTALHKPTRVPHRAQKRRFLEPEPAINDDHLFPDSVTPTKVEKSLSAIEKSMGDKENRYDVPFMDDDAFLPRRLRSPSHVTPGTDDETSSELGYSYGYYEGRCMKADHLADVEDEKSCQELKPLTHNQTGFQAGSNYSSFRWDFSLKMCGCLHRRRRP
ncbi:hypothetical protein SprV_0100293800 [Sparganum proliferum]